MGDMLRNGLAMLAALWFALVAHRRQIRVGPIRPPCNDWLPWGKR